MTWFHRFSESLRLSTPVPDVIGAGAATAEEALAHYRYQHRAKTEEALAETFPVTKRSSGSLWNEIMSSYWRSNPNSPRSLDFIGGVLLQQIDASSVPIAVKDLLRFEWALETFPWRHAPLATPATLEGLTDRSKIILAPYEISDYATTVTEAYQLEELSFLLMPETVIVWMHASGVRYRSLLPWEQKLITELPYGIGKSLEGLEVSASDLEAFFVWLGESQLIQQIEN